MNGSTSRLGQKLLANKYQIFILHPENEYRALLFLKYLIFLHQKDTYYQSKELHELFEAPQKELLLWRNQSMKNENKLLNKNLKKKPFPFSKRTAF